MTVLADIPVDIGRDEARRAAEAELSDRIYQEAQPSLIVRALAWIDDRLAELLGWLGTTVPGGVAGAVLLMLLLGVLVVMTVRLRAGKWSRPHRVRHPAMFTDPQPSAAEHRQAAERAAAEGELTEAVRERFRAIVRGLEERGVLEERSGRTASEAGRAAGRVFPELAGQLRAAATLFDQVQYGGRRATSTDVIRIAELDAAVSRAREAMPV